MFFRLMFGIFCTLSAAAAPAATPPKAGEAAPDFELTDLSGKKTRLADHKGEIVVLEWTSTECPFVLEHYERGTMTKLHEKYKGKVTWLAIDSSFNTSESGLYNWSMRWKTKYPILMDPTGKVGKAYGATATPHMFVIDKKGTLRYGGAIDSDAGNSDPKKVNYVDAALEAVLAGTEVKVPTTAAYGCGIKYMKLPF